MSLFGMSRVDASTRDAAPHDDAAAEAQPPRATVRHAALAEERDGVVPSPEAANARTEEPADLVPARRDEPPCRRQARAHPRFPGRPPDALRHRELEHRNRAAGPDDPRQLTQRRERILDVA